MAAFIALAFRLLPEERFSSFALLNLGFVNTDFLVFKNKALYVHICQVNADGQFGDESTYALYLDILWRDSGDPIQEPQYIISSVLESYERGLTNGNVSLGNKEFHWYV